MKRLLCILLASCFVSYGQFIGPAGAGFGGVKNAGVFGTAAAGGGGAITFVQSDGHNITSTVGSDTITLTFTAGNMVYVSCRIGSTASTVTITDDKSDTFTEIGHQPSGSDHQAWHFYAKNVVGGSTVVTVNIVTPTATVRWGVCEISGCSTSTPLDQNNKASGSSTSPDSGNITTTVANSIILSHNDVDGAVTFTAGSGYGLDQQIPAAPNTKMIIEHKIVSSTGTYSGNSTISSSGPWVAMVANFK